MIIVFISCNSQAVENETATDVLDSKTVEFPVFDSVPKINKPQEDASEFGARYQLVMEGLLRYCKPLDSLRKWQVDTTLFHWDEIVSTEGNEVRISTEDSLTRYQVLAAGETGRFLQQWFVIDNEFMAYYTTKYEYSRPIYWDSVSTVDSTETFHGPMHIEEYPEMSIFRKGKLIYQFSYDCGAPNSEEYIRETQEEALTMLSMLQDLFNTK